MKIIEYINRSLSMASMYKGMAFGLLGIWLAAAVASLLGWLPFDVWAMLASLAVLVVSTYGTSWLCAKLFGAQAHFDSSLITALILALIFTPVIHGGSLVVLGFVGVLAGASKYVLTWRGRHIFNPAALGAVVISIAGLGAASWWVATPLLTPLVLAAALIALYRTKRYDVAGIFLAVSIPLLLIQFLTFGVSVGQSLWLLLSWPLIFIAGVMLTEPLTLPPKKWQMYIVAIITGVLVAVPFKVGAVEMTPALAIIAGNIVAFLLAIRGEARLKFVNRRSLTPTTDELQFELVRPLKYEAGQYIELSLPHRKADLRGTRRSFSITSPADSKTVTLGVKYAVPSSSFKTQLKSLKKGVTIQSTGVWGDFVLPKDTTRPLLFIAGGIGITPFIGHLRTLRQRNENRDIVLVYAISSLEELAYQDELVKSGVTVVLVAPEPLKKLPQGWYMHSASRLVVSEIAENIPELGRRTAYVSGPPTFVTMTKSALRRSGVRRVKTDYFSGY